MSIENDTEVQEERWLAAERRRVEEYLSTEGLAYGVLPADPELHIAPHLALWLVSGPRADGGAWWVVSGDVPTDHVSSQRAPDARQALRTLSKKWRTAASVMAARRDDHNADHLGPDESRRAAEQLFERARRLWDLAAQDDLWE